MLTCRPIAGMESSARSPDDYIFLSDGVKYWVGSVGEIIALEVAGNYTSFFLSNGQKLVMRGALQKWEPKLPVSHFFRANRDCIVNLKYVVEMRMYDFKRFSFTMRGDKEVILSGPQTLAFRRTKGL